MHPLRHAELVSASMRHSNRLVQAGAWTLKQVQGDGFRMQFIAFLKLSPLTLSF
jgi:hypothetical protein